LDRFLPWGFELRLKNGFAVQPATVDAIETDDAVLKIYARHSRDGITSGGASRNSGDSF
jgi:hypothetical protein